MRKLPLLRMILLFVPILAAPAFLAGAQDNPGAKASDELVSTITALDAALFDAYNRCDLDKLGSYFADDLEFYHDQGGLMAGKQKTIDAVKNNICGRCAASWFRELWRCIRSTVTALLRLAFIAFIIPASSPMRPERQNSFMSGS